MNTRYFASSSYVLTVGRWWWKRLWITMFTSVYYHDFILWFWVFGLLSLLWLIITTVLNPHTYFTGLSWLYGGSLALLRWNINFIPDYHAWCDGSVCLYDVNFTSLHYCDGYSLMWLIIISTTCTCWFINQIWYGFFIIVWFGSCATEVDCYFSVVPTAILPNHHHILVLNLNSNFSCHDHFLVELLFDFSFLWFR